LPQVKILSAIAPTIYSRKTDFASQFARKKA
jgi:hypothetical protein